MIGGLVLLFCRVVIIFIIGLFILTPLFKCLFKLSYKQFKVEKKDFAEAKSMSIRANALTKNKALVQYEAVKKWDGKLPTYLMGNSIPFVNIK